MTPERLLDALRAGATIAYVSETHVWYMNGNLMTREDVKVLQQINDQLVWVIDWQYSQWYKQILDGTEPIFNAVLNEVRS